MICLAWSAQAPAAADGDRPEYKLGSGDRVKVTVFGHDDLSGRFLESAAWVT